MMEQITIESVPDHYVGDFPHIVIKCRHSEKMHMLQLISAIDECLKKHRVQIFTTNKEKP